MTKGNPGIVSSEAVSIVDVPETAEEFEAFNRARQNLLKHFRTLTEEQGEEFLNAQMGLIAQFARDQKLLQRLLHEAKTVHRKTGLLNEDGIAAEIDNILLQASRTGVSVVIGLADIDNLKWINTRRGFDKGDEVIIQVARALEQNLRPFDVVGSYKEGDEFLVCLFDADLTVSKRFRAKLDALPVSLGFTIHRFNPGERISHEEAAELRRWLIRHAKRNADRVKRRKGIRRGERG